MSSERTDVRETIEKMIRRVEETRDVDETLQLLTALAVDTIQGVDFASISMRRGDRPIETIAPTHPLAVAMDELQHDFGEGPCFEVATSESVVRSNDLAHELRWPRYGSRASAVGVNAQLAIVLLANQHQRASLNLYARQRDAFNGGLELAELFASQAALVMGLSRTIQQLDRAVGSRTEIGQAVGIVMERFGVDQDRAFSYLTRVSQVSNTKLRDVAANLVGEVVSRSEGEHRVPHVSEDVAQYLHEQRDQSNEDHQGHADHDTDAS